METNGFEIDTCNERGRKGDALPRETPSQVFWEQRQQPKPMDWQLIVTLLLLDHNCDTIVTLRESRKANIFSNASHLICCEFYKGGLPTYLGGILDGY